MVIKDRFNALFNGVYASWLKAGNYADDYISYEVIDDDDTEDEGNDCV